MKKLFLLPLLLCSPLFALPIGNPMDASLYQNGLICGDCYEDCCYDPCAPCFNWCDAWNFRLGFYGDYVFDRHMELDKHNHKDIDDFEIYTNAAFLALNICDRLDVFATLGATDFHLEANSQVFNSGISVLTAIDTETAFSWSVGGRLTIWDCECFYFGIEGQYFRTMPEVDRIWVDSFNLAYPNKSIEMKYSEWQFGIGAAYLMRIGCSGISVIPYLGLKWAGSHADFDNAFQVLTSQARTPSTATLHLYELDNNKVCGWGLGTTILFCDALSVTVEGRWADEKAVHVNGQFLF